jgi:AraC-like DNA-binding protein
VQAGAHAVLFLEIGQTDPHFCWSTLRFHRSKNALSTRTLARRLADESTSYEEVVDQLRRSLALQYIRDEGISFSQIAWLLGYEGSTSFNHAFLRWTGRSPSAARKDKRTRILLPDGWEDSLRIPSRRPAHTPSGRIPFKLLIAALEAHIKTLRLSSRRRRRGLKSSLLTSQSETQSMPLSLPLSGLWLTTCPLESTS